MFIQNTRPLYPLQHRDHQKVARTECTIEPVGVAKPGGKLPQPFANAILDQRQTFFAPGLIALQNSGRPRWFTNLTMTLGYAPLEQEARATGCPADLTPWTVRMRYSTMAILEQFGSDIWVAAGPTVASAGFRYPTRMAIIRLSDSRLFLWSPVAISAELRAQIDALGEVRFLVTPNSLHHLFLQEWRAAYPNAVLYAAPGSRERRRDIAFDDDLGDEPAQAWAGQIEQVPMRGNLITTEVVFFHHKSGVVLFADLIQHFKPGWFNGWRAVVARLDGMVGAHPQVPKKFRAAFIDRKVAREGLERVLAWPAEKVVMAHAEPIREDGRAFIERVFRWLR